MRGKPRGLGERAAGVGRDATSVNPTGAKPRLLTRVKSHTVVQLGTKTHKIEAEPSYATARGQLSGQREGGKGLQDPKS